MEICGKVFAGWNVAIGASTAFEAAGRGKGLQAFRACSACAGDYEDPDCTAGDTATEDPEDEPGGENANDEFPANEP